MSKTVKVRCLQDARCRDQLLGLRWEPGEVKEIASEKAEILISGPAFELVAGETADKKKDEKGKGVK